MGERLILSKAKGTPTSAPSAREIVVRGLQSAALAELFLHVLGAVEPAFGDRRIELIGPPAHHDRARFFRKRFLQAFLAEIAPGAHDVADDVDGENLIRFAHGPWLLHTQAPYLALPADERKPTSAAPRTPFRRVSCA